MTKEEIVNLANKCSRKIWEICMEEPEFSTNDCPEGANGLSDIILNTILKAFPAIKECSSLPSSLDEAAHDYAWEKQDMVYDAEGEILMDYGPRYDAFKAGAEWMEKQGVSVNAISSTEEDGITEEGMKLISDYLESLPDKTEVVLQIRKKQ